MKTKRNRVILLMCVTLFWAAQYMFMPYQTPYMTALGIASDTIGMIVGAYGFTQMLLRFPIGINADHKAKHKPFIAIGFGCVILTAFIRMFSDSAVLFLLANLVAGIGSSMWISFTILFSNMYTEEELRSSISLVSSFNQLGVLSAYLLGLLIYPKLSVNSLFISSIILAAAGMALSFFITEETSGGASLSIGEIVKGSLSKRLFFFAFLMLLVQAVCQSTQSSFTSQVAKNLGASSSGLGILSIVTMASSFFGSSLLNVGKIKKIPVKYLVLVCGIFYTCYCLAVGFAKSLPVVFIAQAFGSVANAQFSSLFMSSAIQGCRPESKSTAMGIYQAIYSVGMTVGPVIMGAAVENVSFTFGFCIMALIAAAVAGIYFLLRKKADAE